MPLIGTGRPNIERLRRREDLEGLRAAVTYREERVDFDGSVHDTGASLRVAALEALSGFFGPPVLQGVRDGLRDEHPDVRLAAVRAAAAAELHTAQTELLTGVATWSDPPYGEAVDEAFRLLLQWQLPDTPEQFANELSRNHDIALSDAHRATLLGFAAADPRGEEACLEALAGHLVARLSDGAVDVEVRSRVGTILSWLESRAVSSLADAFSDGGLDSAGVAVAGDLRDNRLLAPLISQAEAPDPEVRAAAATALGKLLDTRGVVTLMELTQDDVFAVRRAAARALDSFGMSAVVVGLAASMPGTSPQPSPESARWIQRALKRADSPGDE